MDPFASCLADESINQLRESINPSCVFVTRKFPSLWCFFPFSFPMLLIFFPIGNVSNTPPGCREGGGGSPLSAGTPSI